VAWHVQDILDLERDHDLLIGFGEQNVESAVFVSSSITAARPGFWPVAVALLSRFHESDALRRNVASAAEQVGHVINGPWSAHLIACALDVEQAVEQNHVSGRVREFLTELVQRFRAVAETQRIQEANEEINF
jgi:hypothetical protein